MSATSIEISVKALKGFLSIMPKQDIRSYLHGLSIDFPNGRIAVTDGFRLLIKKIEPKASGPVAIIPRELIEQVTRLKCADPNVVITISETTEDKRDDSGTARKVKSKNVELCRGAGIYRALPVNATYPNLDSVIPQRVSGKAAQFNPQYVASLSDALKAIAEQKDIPAQLVPNGDGPGVVFLDAAPALLGIVMPMHSKDPHTEANAHLKGFAPVAHSSKQTETAVAA